MRIYSDSKVSDFIAGITCDQSIGFLNEWNAARNHKEKIYISYNSTNKSCQAGDNEIVEFGHPKDGKDYPGSIIDMSQLQIMLEKAKGYGYKKAGFILDRGYFSKSNIRFTDKNGYNFVIMVKGMKSFIRELIIEKTLFPSDEKTRYFILYRIEMDTAIVDNIFHELQDFENILF